jgi:hypothetical protein
MNQPSTTPQPITIESLKKGDYITFEIYQTIRSEFIRLKTGVSMWSELWETTNGEIISVFQKESTGIYILSKKPIVKAKFAGVNEYNGKVQIKVRFPKQINSTIPSRFR